MQENTVTSISALLANEAGYDPIEDRLRQNIRAFIEAGDNLFTTRCGWQS